jgi:hypothetical protein
MALKRVSIKTEKIMEGKWIVKALGLGDFGELY